MVNLIVISLLAGGNRDGQPVLGRRQRTGCIGRKGARWIHQAIKVEPKFSWLRDSVIGKAGVQKASRAVGGCLARRVAHDEE